MQWENTDQVLCETADEAERELERSYKAPGGRDGLKRLLKRILGRETGAWDPVSWTTGLLLLGLLEAGRTGAVSRYLDRWIEDGHQIRKVDDAVAGYCLVCLFESTKEERYRAAAEEIWHFLQQAPRTKKGTIIYSPAQTSCVFADGIGQSALFLSAYGKIFDVPEAGELAAVQLLNFWHDGFDRNTGLMYHGYEEDRRLKHGIIGWGRAVGWILMGWSGYLSCYAGTEVRKAAEGTATDPEAGHTAELMAAFRQLTENVLRYQRQDHLFSWQLEAVEGPLDTSASGMIFWALLHAAQAGVPCRFGRDAVLEAAGALADEINGGAVYGCSGECIDFGQYPQQYGRYPWGQGAVLAFLGLTDRTIAGNAAG